MSEKQNKSLPAKKLTKDELDKKLDALDKVIEENSIMALSNSPGKVMRDSAKIAIGIEKLRSAMDDTIMDMIMHLKGTPLGFLTDENDGSHGKKPVRYSVEQIKTISIEGLMKGARLVGNEINAIAGRCYLTQSFFERRLKEMKDTHGLTNLDIAYSPIEWKSTAGKISGAVVTATAKFLLEKKKMEKEVTFEIKANNWSSAEAVIGKAYKKICQTVFNMVMNTSWELGEVDEAETAKEALIVDKGKPDEATADDDLFSPGEHVIDAELETEAQTSPGASKNGTKVAPTAPETEKEGKESTETEKGSKTAKSEQETAPDEPSADDSGEDVDTEKKALAKEIVGYSLPKSVKTQVIKEVMIDEWGLDVVEDADVEAALEDPLNKLVYLATLKTVLEKFEQAKAQA